MLNHHFCEGRIQINLLAISAQTFHGAKTHLAARHWGGRKLFQINRMNGPETLGHQTVKRLAQHALAAVAKNTLSPCIESANEAACIGADDGIGGRIEDGLKQVLSLRQALHAQLF